MKSVIYLVLCALLAGVALYIVWKSRKAVHRADVKVIASTDALDDRIHIRLTDGAISRIGANAVRLPRE